MLQKGVDSPDNPEDEIEFPALLQEGDNGEWGVIVYNAIKKLQDGSVKVETIYDSTVFFTGVDQVGDTFEFYAWEWVHQSISTPEPMYAILYDDGFFEIIYW